MTETTAEPSVLEDLLEIFYAPGRVFERRRETPAFGLAVLIFAVVMIGLGYAFKDLMAPVLDAEITRSLTLAARKNPKITPEMITTIKAASEKWVLLGAAVVMVLMPLLIGLFAWVVGKFFGSVAQLGQAMMVGAYAVFPRVVESIVSAVQMLVLSPDDIDGRGRLTFGIGRFLNPDTTNPMLFATLIRIDVFTLWVTVLITIGIARLGKLTTGQAIGFGVSIWVVGGLYTLFQAARV